MKRFVEWLRLRNRTLLELRTGIVLYGMICQIGGFFLAKDQLRCSLSIWFGILMAIVTSIHMYRSLDKALDFDENTATKRIYSSYLIRYFAVAGILMVICITDVLEALLVFLAYMSLKGAAFMQPFTHKFYNWFFREEDPIPVTEEEAMAAMAAMAAETEKSD